MLPCPALGVAMCTHVHLGSTSGYIYIDPENINASFLFEYSLDSMAIALVFETLFSSKSKGRAYAICINFFVLLCCTINTIYCNVSQS